MKYAVIDFETFSRADLKKVGGWKYAHDLSTFPICLSVKVFVDRKPEPTFCLTERQIHALDKRLLDLVNDPAVMILAHNCSFEMGMWAAHMVPAGYPPLPPERWHDSMATAAMKALPLGLDAAIAALELPVKKDMEGHALMLRLCKPDKDNSTAHHTPENLSRLYEYCNRDVESQAGLFHATGGLGPDERSVWILDQKIQQRGLLIDTEFVHACIDVLDQVRIPMTEEFRQITGLNPTQREKILNWVNDQGVGLGDLKKATLDAILDPDDEFDLADLGEPIPPHVHKALTLRRKLASASVSKLERMLTCAGQDGRVRYATQYHGARTGRDAGRLIQIQNYPRGEISDRQGLTADILADAILTRNVPHIKELWGEDIFSAIISSLRSCVIPAKGKVLVSGDFAAVEARNLLSFAGQHDRVEQMHNGLDVYSEMASLIYKRPINRKVHQKEGQIGKNTVLGCLSKDTLVLTSNGWKAIVEVERFDLLWDGENWVMHHGLAFKGLKETLNLSGLRMTPDHTVFAGDEWFPASDATKPLLSRALAFAKDHGPFSDMPIPNTDFSRGRYVHVPAEMVRSMSMRITSNLENLPVAERAAEKRHAKAIEHAQNMTIFAPTKKFENALLVAYLELSDAANSQDTNDTPTMEVEVSGSISKTNKNAWPIWSHWKGLTTRIWKSTGLKTTGIMKKVISGFPLVRKTTKTAEASKNYKLPLTLLSKKTNCSEPVYDLVNAGPHNRFMVMTLDGPLIVHNSGYGLGPVGFQARFAPNETFELAQLAIASYRADFAPKVVKFWYGLFQASVDAVWCEMSKTYSYEGIEFRKEGDFLTMRLPSTRKIWYHRPRKATTYTPDGDERPAWSFMSYQGKKFRRHLAWHGMITADCIQGSARDMMTSAAKRAEKAGLFSIFKVHDELVFEETDRPDLETIVAQIMEEREPWMIERRLRVKANVEKMNRYRK